ncbi:MAG: DoxX family protein [Nitrospirae bacterium]|nr:DoxX family protein [Nitrospirota bacterium]
MKSLFQTDEAWTGLILRVMLGVVMFPHGAQKLLGWFGGFGFSGTMGFFTDQMHIPAVLAFLVVITESFGSLGLIIGLLSRVAAFGIACIMVVAIWLVHWPHGFFMNWFGKQAGEGFEYHLLVLAVCAALLLTGGGKWSVDGAIVEQMQDEPAT